MGPSQSAIGCDDTPSLHSAAPLEPAPESVPKPKIKFIEDVKWWQQTAAQIARHFAQHAALYATVAQHLEPLPIISSNVFQARVLVMMAGGKADLTAAFKILRALGFEPTERPDTQKRTEWMGSFNHPSGARVELNFTSTQCKRVVTGKKMVEIEEFDIVCDEETAS